MANYIGNIVNVYGENSKTNELKEFLIKHSETVSDEACIDFKDSMLEDKAVWFSWSWNEKYTCLFDIESLETDTMHFYTSWVSSLDTIIKLSGLFPEIEFILKWQPRQLFDCNFGYSKIKLGKVIEYNDDVPQKYIDEMNELLIDDEKHPS